MSSEVVGVPWAEIQRVDDTTHATGAGVELARDSARVAVVAVGVAVTKNTAGGAEEIRDRPWGEHGAARLVGRVTAVEVGRGQNLACWAGGRGCRCDQAGAGARDAGGTALSGDIGWEAGCDCVGGSGVGRTEAAGWGGVIGECAEAIVCVAGHARGKIVGR